MSNGSPKRKGWVSIIAIFAALFLLAGLLNSCDDDGGGGLFFLPFFFGGSHSKTYGDGSGFRGGGSGFGK